MNGLKLDHWSKGIASAGIALAIAALGFGNHGALLVGLGLALYGFGEWINHPLHTEILRTDNPYHAWKGEGYRRKTSLLGTLFVIAGLAVSLIGLHAIYLNTQ